LWNTTHGGYNRQPEVGISVVNDFLRGKTNVNQTIQGFSCGELQGTQAQPEKPLLVAKESGIAFLTRNLAIIAGV